MAPVPESVRRSMVIALAGTLKMFPLAWARILSRSGRVVIGIGSIVLILNGSKG